VILAALKSAPAAVKAVPEIRAASSGQNLVCKINHRTGWLISQNINIV
jgi:hypothetical protein